MIERNNSFPRMISLNTPKQSNNKSKTLLILTTSVFEREIGIPVYQYLRILKLIKLMSKNC
jgi:hypothetical protein